MAADRSGQIEIVVDTLLAIGEWVTEVSRDHVMTRIWKRKNSTLLLLEENYLGKKILEAGNAGIMTVAEELVTKSFLTGENGYIEYSADIGNVHIIYGMRILTCHPDKDYLFFVMEDLSAIKGTELVEDKWKLALDATGDGVWDLNMETNAIFFSEKWHEIFGYNASDIVTGDDWSGKIHPDDLARNKKKSEEYLAGKIPSYTTEMRYLCKDGTYKWILSRGVIISKNADGKPLRFIGTHTDINERKIAEEKYYTTSKLLSTLINNLQDGILVTDEYRKVIFVNQMFCDIFHIKGNPEAYVGMDMWESVEARKHFYRYQDLYIERAAEILDKQELVINEEWEFADGRTISRDYIPVSLGVNYKGEIWKLRDITNQKNTEKRFEEQRLFYERILNNIPADIAVFDGEHRYLFVNKHAFKNDELRQWMIGKTDEDYARYSNRPASFVKNRFALYDSALKEGKIEFIEKLTSNEGEIGHHLRLVHPVFYEDGALEFIMAYGVGITDLIAAQDELKTSIETFSNAFHHSGIGMALIGLDGKWMDVNNVLCELTGYSKGELLRLTYHDITFPEDDEMDRELIAKLLNMEITTYTVEKRYISKANKIVLVSLTVSLVWNHDDKPRFFIAQVVDITKRKELENEIRRKNTELEAARISLVNKITQLEELSHIIAHNLRGPAGNVKTFSEILLAKQNGDTSNKLADAFTSEEAVQFINESSIALMGSLSTLMEITEIKLNKEIPYNDCDVASVVNGITSQLQGIIHEKKAVIKLQLEVKTISYPKAYLENILYNLISNALKYSRLVQPPEIIVTTLLNNGRIQIIVKDNGLGIDLERYGDRVFKLSQVFHSGYDSKGIGLYITKTQIESFGGTIELKSKPNEGCEFIVTL